MAELSISLPCSVGDTIYSFNWDTRESKYVLIEEKCLGFNIRSNEGYDILVRGEKFEHLRSSKKFNQNWFITSDGANAKLELLNEKAEMKPYQG
jgi:hypothetical protein